MKSIKLGRGPSFMSGMISLAAGVFGIFWMIFAASMGGGFFALFGLIFVFIAISQAIYSFKNATSKNRFSTFDITDDKEEIDPLNLKYGQNSMLNTNTKNSGENIFQNYNSNDSSENILQNDNPNVSDENILQNDNSDENTKSVANKFCPYCGTKLDIDFEFCNKCGRKLP